MAELHPVPPPRPGFLPLPASRSPGDALGPGSEGGDRLAGVAHLMLEGALAGSVAVRRLAQDCGEHMAARLLLLSADEQLASARDLAALACGQGSPPAAAHDPVLIAVAG